MSGFKLYIKIISHQVLKIVERIRDEIHSILIKIEIIVLDVIYKYKNYQMVLILKYKHLMVLHTELEFQDILFSYVTSK
jgi:hypothetical protein